MSLLDIDGSKTMTPQGVEFTLDNWLPDAVASSKYRLPRNQSDHCILGDLGDIRNILMATLAPQAIPGLSKMVLEARMNAWCTGNVSSDSAVFSLLSLQELRVFLLKAANPSIWVEQET